MDIEKLLGYVYYDNDYYIFTFDNYKLQLIPRKKEDLIDFKIKNSRLFVEPKCDKKFISDVVLEGECFDGRHVAFCVQDYNALERKVRWVYIGAEEPSKLNMNGIGFISQEINCFYDIRKYIADDLNLANTGDYTYTLNIKSQEPEKLGNFIFDGVKIDVVGNMVWKKNYDVSNNLEIWSKIYLEFSEGISDLNKVYNLVMLQRDVINFLTYRLNNSFDAIEIYKLNVESKKETIGRFYISDSCLKETNYKDVKHIITIDKIKDIGKLYKIINENKIYEHYYCDSYFRRSIYTPSRMLGIIIAFERLIGWKYKEEDVRSKVRKKSPEIFLTN